MRVRWVIVGAFAVIAVYWLTTAALSRFGVRSDWISYGAHAAAALAVGALMVARAAASVVRAGHGGRARGHDAADRAPTAAAGPGDALMADAPSSVDMVALFNAQLGGFERALGLTFTRITPNELVAEVPVVPALMQPYGIVHGGVYASIIETLASAGAAIHAMREGKTCIGLENTTSFLRAVRGGKLVAVATPVHCGSTSQVWEVEVSDERGRLLATGRVSTKSLEADTAVEGEVLRVKT